MLGKELGTFDHVVAMDSIIHYQIEDAIDALSQPADRTSGSIIFTFAPRTPLLAAMISIGRLLPKSDRAPWLQPMAEKRIGELMDTHETLEGGGVHALIGCPAGFINHKPWNGYTHESHNVLKIC